MRADTCEQIEQWWIEKRQERNEMKIENGDEHRFHMLWKNLYIKYKIL